MLQMTATHPINSVRNMAILLARTELILPVDVDMVPSRDLSDLVRSSERCEQCCRKLDRDVMAGPLVCDVLA